ncbi:hypothetical protein D1155_11575 [Anaerotruncus sp. 80]|uniref:Uncharacterized protein n=1 Tax=Anaerotruncus colihominis TaxID=169435 RepID=A0A845QJJ4_9FIRM|nr:MULTISPECIES: hypothetical protein [Clostridia]NBH62290.1 hypothetical protein [Anaerotruncus colihominis]NCF00453.1 hypothetical protein [Emergencia sp. 1XD21-10]NCF02945.1 hypothetical protein [Anaerotruncus sp. 80]
MSNHVEKKKVKTTKKMKEMVKDMPTINQNLMDMVNLEYRADSELYKSSKAILEAYGYTVCLFDLENPSHSTGYKPNGGKNQ